ncbi:hypothetical protein D7X30_40670 [Corallococcus sp. AB011P]|nr:hypothetical protein D7X30_40670 [Corallococcus sp. AB011P]
MAVQHPEMVVVHRGAREAVEHSCSVLRGNVQQFAKAIGKLTHDEEAVGAGAVAHRTREGLVVR